MKKLMAEYLIRVSLLAAFGLLGAHAMAADVPAKPAHYFNDYASLIDPRTAQQLDKRLEDFERQTSNQIVAAIYQGLPADAAIEAGAKLYPGPGKADRHSATITAGEPQGDARRAIEHGNRGGNDRQADRDIRSH